MRTRIKQMRKSLIEKLKARVPGRNFDFVLKPSAACSPTPASPRTRWTACAANFGLRGIDTGRICVAALNTQNIDYVAHSIAKVIA